MPHLVVVCRPQVARQLRRPRVTLGKLLLLGRCRRLLLLATWERQPLVALSAPTRQRHRLALCQERLARSDARRERHVDLLINTRQLLWQRRLLLLLLLGQQRLLLLLGRRRLLLLE
jgi:hypothetical protein